MSVEMRRVATSYLYLIREGRRWSAMTATRAALLAENRNLRRDMVLARRFTGLSVGSTCRTCSGGGRVANVGTQNASRRLICQDCCGTSKRSITRPVLLRSQPTTAGDSTSDREASDAPAPRKPGRVSGQGAGRVAQTPTSADAAGCTPRACPTTTTTNSKKAPTR